MSDLYHAAVLSQLFWEFYSHIDTEREDATFEALTTCARNVGWWDDDEYGVPIGDFVEDFRQKAIKEAAVTA